MLVGVLRICITLAPIFPECTIKNKCYSYFLGWFFKNFRIFKFSGSGTSHLSEQEVSTLLNSRHGVHNQVATPAGAGE